MLLARRGALFAVGKFVLLCGLLLVPWPGLATVCSLSFCILSTSVAEGFVSDRDLTVRFEPTDSTDLQGLERDWTVQLSLVNVRTGQRDKVSLDLRRIGYVPFVLFSGLVFAVSIDRRRKRYVFVCGSLALGLRLAATVGLPLASFLGVFESGSLAYNASQVVFRSFIEPPNMLYAIPVVLFLVGLMLTHAQDAEPPIDSRRFPRVKVRSAREGARSAIS
jgi:hypothetical protein